MRLRHTAVSAGIALAVVTAMASPAAAKGGRDSDHDGIPNRWEVSHGLNPHKKRDARKDKDHDGLTNITEFRIGGDPRDKDTDNDGVDDRFEFRHHTKVFRADSDGDGIKDGNEDADRDGICDRDHKVAFGVVTSFDAATGALVVTTTAGGTLSVTVTDETRIEQREHRGWHHRPPSVPGDDDADEPGEDDGDDSADEPGDDGADEPGVTAASYGEDEGDEPGDDDGEDSDEDSDEDGDTDDDGLVDPPSVDLLVTGAVVLKMKFNDDGSVKRIRLA